MNEEELKTRIRSILRDDLDPDELATNPSGVTGGAVKLFQRLFVEHLHFDLPAAAMDELGEDLPTDDWSKYALAEQAYIIAEDADFRVVYIELEKLTRTAERHAISSMRGRGWVRRGEFLAIFHAPDSDVWHIVSPYAEEGHEVGDGRTILRRYVVGRGENHRTVTENLAKMDADAPEPLFDLVQEAFRLRPVTEEFYESYKTVFGRLDGHLREQGFEIEEAKRYAHLTLNRLMFLYFIQKKGWLNGDKRFMDWFTEQYLSSNHEDCFHERWLSALFFDSMNTPEGTEIEADLPDDIRTVLRDLPFFNGGLFEREELDRRDVHFPDRLIVDTVIRRFLETYNFTVSEESAFDLDVAVDPAMLGKIYESLIAEQERGEAGIFYTPRVEVDLMCRLGLYDQLVQRLDDTSEEALVAFLFTPLEQWEGDSLDSEEVISTLHDLDIVDPACGSGAFIVGMMQVLLDLHRKLDVTPDYDLKEQLVNDSLYGVDIKDWAVRVAEFRLWLSLVEAEEDLPGARPVLPNLSMKLRVGDSIVQKAGNEFIRLDDIGRRADTETQDKLDDLQDLKERFFLGARDLQAEIKETQKEILLEHLASRIDYLEQEKSRQRQTNLEGEVTEAAEERMEELQEEIEALEHTRTLLAEDSALFIWGLDFPEVMLRGGFDVVIGNPPYVRQRKIIDQSLDPERLDQLSDEELKRRKKEYKSDLRAYVQDAFDLKPGLRSDLYLYFFFKGLDLLDQEGTLVFVSSNSWLNVNYGAKLQEGILKNSRLRYVLDNRAEPIFEEADVNTVITACQKTETPRLDSEPSFLTFYTPYAQTVSSDLMKDALLGITEQNIVKRREETLMLEEIEKLRRVSMETSSLWKLGGGKIGTQNSESIPMGSYSGDEKWATFLQAPTVYFRVLERNKDKLATIEDITDDIFRGITSGANDFFYPDGDTIERFSLPDEVLVPLLKSVRNLDRRAIHQDDIERKLVLLPPDPEKTPESVQEYIEWGEEEGIHQRTTLQSREPWYSLGEVKQASLIWPKEHYTHQKAFLSDKPLYLDQQCYGIIPSDDIDPRLLFAILNSTYCCLIKLLISREMSGRSIKNSVDEVEEFLIPDPREFDGDTKQRLIEISKRIAEAPIQPVWEEYEDHPREDLDSLISEILSLSEEDRNELQDGVERLTKQVLKRDRQR